MKVSTKGRYGLKAMIDIAAQEKGACVNLKSIAERQGISENYLEQLAVNLKKAGFVKSIRGAQGGYVLNMPACEISVGDILRALEGSLAPVNCLDETKETRCGDSNCDNCVTKPVWEKMYDSLNTVVDAITLDELAQNYRTEGPGTDAKGDEQFGKDLF